MKNSVLACGAALLIAGLITPPAAAAVKFDLGLKAGVSISRLREAYSDPSYEVDYSERLNRPVLGAFVAVNLSRAFAIQPEIFFVTEGGTWMYESIMVPDRLFVHYIYIPVLAKFRLINKSHIVPVIFAGPSWNIFLSDHYEVYIDGEWGPSPFPIEATYKPSVGNIVMGFGVEYILDKFLLILDFRYDIGVGHLADRQAYSTPHGWARTRATMIMLGIGI
jgi:hypothetical protein